MFSSRTPASLHPSPASQALEQLKQRLGSYLDLTLSNPTRAELDRSQHGVLSSLTHPAALEYAADPRGVLRARAALAHYYATRGLPAFPLDQIFLTASTSEAYGFLMKLLTNPGDEVLVPQPSYPLFDHLLQLEALRAVPYPLRFDGSWYIDPGALPARITPRTRAIILVSPNNPTGSWTRADELDWLEPLCERHHLALISDEVFMDFALNPPADRVPVLAARERVLSFSLGGLSKTLGLPQLKLGWILVNGPAPLLSEALERLEFITDTYLSVGAPVQEALPRLLEQRDALQRPIQQRLAHNRATVERLARTCPYVTVLPTEGGWSQLLRVPRVMTEEEWVYSLLSARQVLVQPGYFFDLEPEGHLVLSLLTPPQHFESGLHALFEHIGLHSRAPL